MAYYLRWTKRSRQDYYYDDESDDVYNVNNNVYNDVYNDVYDFMDETKISDFCNSLKAGVFDRMKSLFRSRKEAEYKVRNQKNEIKNLMNLKTDLEGNVQYLEYQPEAARRERDQVKASFERGTLLAANITRESDDLRKRIVDQDRAIEEAKRQNEKLQLETATLKQRIENDRAAFQALRQMKHQLEHTVATERANLARLNGEKDRLNEEKEKVSSEKNQLERERECAICEEKAKGVVFDCGHSACRSCAAKLKDCHVCRERVKHMTVFYLN